MEDVVTLADETVAGAVPLLACVMRQGQRVQAEQSLAQMAVAVGTALATMPTLSCRLRSPQVLVPRYSAAVIALAQPWMQPRA